MNSLVIAAMTFIAIYVVAMIYTGKQIPESISQTVFLLPRKGQWVFTVVMVMVAFLLMPVLFEKVQESTQFIVFFMSAGILVVGVAPLVMKEKNTIHYVFAAISGIASQLLVALNRPLLLFTWFGYVGYTLLAKDVSKNLFWVEVLCILNVFTLCFVL